MKIKPNELSYKVLPGRFCNPEHLSLFDQAYQFWFSNWSRVYQELKTDIELCPDIFFKQDFIPLICHQEEIVAIHLYSIYDLRSECSLQQTYLHHNFNNAFFANLKNRHIETVMSMEALFVNPAYRRSKTELNFKEILISLGQKIFESMTLADAIVAPARLDNNVAQTGYPIGFEVIVPELTLNNVPVELLICRRGQSRPVPTESSRFLVESLWQRKTVSSPTAQTKAA